MRTFSIQSMLLSAILCLLISLSNETLAQNYSTYYTLINSAEEKFILNRDSSCYAAYDQAFAQYSPYLKDPFIASQIAFSLGDTNKFYAYLKICFQHGMPLSVVNASPFIRKGLHAALMKEISLRYSEYYIEKKYDPILYDEIALMSYQSDSIKAFMGKDTSLINAFNRSEHATRSFLLDRLLHQGIFPNQMLFGISSDAKYDAFYTKTGRPDIRNRLDPFRSISPIPVEYNLYLERPDNIILHSRCFYTEHKDLFIQAMLNGYMHPKAIGILEETAVLWHKNDHDPQEKCPAAPYKIGYNIYGYNPMSAQQIFTSTPSGIAQVEKNRKAIYMQKFSIDLEKRKLEKMEGFKFFFDFALK